MIYQGNRVSYPSNLLLKLQSQYALYFLMIISKPLFCSFNCSFFFTIWSLRKLTHSVAITLLLTIRLRELVLVTRPSSLFSIVLLKVELAVILGLWASISDSFYFLPTERKDLLDWALLWGGGCWRDLRWKLYNGSSSQVSRNYRLKTGLMESVALSL